MKRLKKWGLILLIIVMIGLLLPQPFTMPVEGASKKSYHQESFWFYPWGKSGTHKGVDIFAKQGTNVLSAITGLVVYTGQFSLGGKVVIVLGPKWRLHYYAHLNEIHASAFSWKRRGEIIGTVGTSGNAKGKEPHLHYSIYTAIPYVWRIENDHQGWKKMFYLNPVNFLNATFER